MNYYKIDKNNIYLRKSMLEVYKHKCLYCGIALEARHTQIDHILPINEQNIVNINDSDLQAYINELKKITFPKIALKTMRYHAPIATTKKVIFTFLRQIFVSTMIM